MSEAQVETIEAQNARLRKRVEWLEGLFDFSDEEIVSHTAPNDPVTAGSIVLRREHYEEVQAQRRAAIAAVAAQQS